LSFRRAIFLFAAIGMLQLGFSPFFQQYSCGGNSKGLMFVYSLSLSPSSRPDNNGMSRRDVLSKTTQTAAGIAAATSPLFPLLTAIQAADAATGGAGGPIAVVGATGRTGSLCVNACLRRGIAVKALTRTGVWNAPPTPDGAVTTFDGDTSQLLSIAKCDVKDIAALQTNIEGCRAVIYAASASKNGGSAYDVDNVGVVRTAEACLKANVSRYVVITSTATTRPKSLGYIFTNLSVGGNIMGEKRNGELGIIDSYKQKSASSPSPSYTIIRPGGLEEPKRNKVLGPSVLEVSQGDIFAGIISRADVAEFTVELATTTTIIIPTTTWRMSRR
jgi:hypothetical protein